MRALAGGDGGGHGGGELGQLARTVAGHTFYGHGAALYAYRAAACGDRTPVEARLRLRGSEAGRSSWDAAKVVGASLAAATDCVLSVLLTGLVPCLWEQRPGSEWRSTRGSLPPVRSCLDEVLKEIRLVRNTILTRVLSWSDGRDDEAIARLAAMSPAAVAEWRDRLTADQGLSPE
ncbi:hypothetical protein [Kitasatospora sp. NPDC050463]|uniref:hypothetical protein n=1 Tax=Kitasatospora sp. NPDC050463 TaxID=3155786 RepID=UPI0033CCD38C